MYCWSSSFMDGGVRWKMIALDPVKWDVIDVPAIDGLRALDWFTEHAGAKYDIFGLLATSLPVPHSKKRFFCNEAIGAAANLTEAWRFDPTDFARVVQLLPRSKWIQGGAANDPVWLAAEAA
jgi:hypothetical protein